MLDDSWPRELIIFNLHAAFIDTFAFALDSNTYTHNEELFAINEQVAVNNSMVNEQLNIAGLQEHLREYIDQREVGLLNLVANYETACISRTQAAHANSLTQLEFLEKALIHRIDSLQVSS